MARRPDPQPDLLSRAPADARVVFLIDAATAYEASLLTQWLRRQAGPQPATIRIASSRRGSGGDDEALTAVVDADDDPFLIPVRALWLAPRRKDGRRAVSWTDVLQPGDPRDPRGLRARWIRNLRPDRFLCIAGRGAQVSELVAAHAVSGTIDTPVAFLTRRAWTALDQEERKVRGNRYKVPRFVPEAILSSKDFLDSVDRVSAASSLAPAQGRAKAEHYLREIAASHSTYVIDLIANFIHKLYKMGYGEIRYDADQVAAVADLGQTRPLVFLPSHRSNLDRLSLQFMLWENDLPPNHTAGGINLNFFPIGQLMRRTGVFFIRRTFKDNDLYKLVLRSYIDYLIEKRFSLEWYMEGGRSRSGRLGPPKLGLLSYVVDAQRHGRAEDIALIPVSIAYDQIQDVADYALEAQGRAKQRESLGWLFKAVRSLRREYGNIHIRFGAPLSVAESMGEERADAEESLALQKMAFEVMYRIGRITPVTPVAVVTIALLAARGTARSAAQIADDCHFLTRFVEGRSLPTTEPLDLHDAGRVTVVLDWLGEHGNVSSHQALERRVFWLDDEQMIRIAYYRNVIVHYFVPRALAEMALRSQLEAPATLESVQAELLALRDLLKFDFFFQDKERFLAEVAADVEIDVPGWDSLLASGGPEEILAKMGPSVSGWALLPILDAYQVVGDELAVSKLRINEKSFLKSCLDRARMYRLEDPTVSGESASQVLFRTALDLAANRGLLDDAADVRQRRQQFAEEVRRARGLAASGL